MLRPEPAHGFRSGKTYTHAEGLSCCFRQWRADSHCNRLHGYSLQVEFSFLREGLGLDERNWVQDFGGLKEVKQFLKDTYDHKTIVALDDPQWDRFMALNSLGIIDLVAKPAVGCEAFAQDIFNNVRSMIDDAHLEKVIVREHAGNWAEYGLSYVAHTWPWNMK